MNIEILSFEKTYKLNVFLNDKLLTKKRKQVLSTSIEKSTKSAYKIIKAMRKKLIELQMAM